MNDTLSSDDAMPMFYVGESDYSFTVPKSHPDIMAELDAAMTQILTSNPRYNDEIKTRYSVINVGSSSLTDRERDWIASCDNTVTVGYLDDLRPYSLRGKDGRMEGALSAVVSDMRERFGITVNERAYSSNSDLEAALGRGEIDVAPRLPRIIGSPIRKDMPKATPWPRHRSSRFTKATTSAARLRASPSDRTRSSRNRF